MLSKNDDDEDEDHPLPPKGTTTQPTKYWEPPPERKAPPEEPPDVVRDTVLERQMPSSPEAEKAILGGIILDNMLIADAIQLLHPDDFYVPSHKRIFIVMVFLFEKGSEINPILIGEELKKENALESVGGISFITNLTYGLPHTTNISHYARVVIAKSTSRKLIKAHAKGLQEAYDEQDDPEIVADHSLNAIFSLVEDRLEDRSALVGDVVEGVMTIARENAGHGVLVTGLATGLVELDELLGGLQKQHLVTVAGRPSMGKSALAACIAEHIVLNSDAVVVIFSLEMSKEELATRMACSLARVDNKRFRDGVLSSADWKALGEAAEQLRYAKLILDDEFSRSALGMMAKSRQVKQKFKRLDLIIADSLQLMAGDGTSKRIESREREVAMSSRAMKGVAKNLNVPVILISNINRQPEGRVNKRPMLSDLRESGSIEYDSDEVIFVYREAYYQEQLHQEVTNPFEAELIVAKARSGNTGLATVRFDRKITRFENLYKDES